MLAEVSDRYLTDADKFIFYCHDGKEGQYAVTLSVAEVITEYRASITEKSSEGDASSLVIRTHVAFDGTVGDVTDIDNGYVYEVAIPKTLLGVEDMLAFRFRLISRDSANGKTVQEDPYPSAGLKDTSGWAKAKLVP